MKINWTFEREKLKETIQKILKFLEIFMSLGKLIKMEKLLIKILSKVYYQKVKLVIKFSIFWNKVINYLCIFLVSLKVIIVFLWFLFVN